MSRNYDNWERLVAAVLKRDQFWQLCHQDSLDSSFSSSFSSSTFSSSLSFRSLTDVNLEDGSENEYVVDQKPIVPKLVFLGRSGRGRGFVLTDTLKFKEELGKGTFGITRLAELLVNVHVSNEEFLARETKVVTKSMHDVIRVTEEDEFKQRIQVLGSYCSKHENVGAPKAYYFSNKPNRTLLVYDYFSKGSVSNMLYGRNPSPPIVFGSSGSRRRLSSTSYNGMSSHLSWKSRRRIAIGAARGIAHIHSQSGGKLAHGNIKSSNVFLNSKRYGCVSDFGFAGTMVKPVPTRNALGHTYTPQPYYYNKNLSQDLDVRNFGLILLELLTGVSPVDAKGIEKDEYLYKWALSIKPEKWTSKLFDRRLCHSICNENDLIEMMTTEIPGFDPAVVPLVKDSVTDTDLEALRMILLSHFHSMDRVPADYFPVLDLSEMVEMFHVARKCLSENTPMMSDVVSMLENKEVHSADTEHI